MKKIFTSKSLKKLLGIALVMLSLFALTACGADKQTDAEPKTGSTDNTSAAVQTEEGDANTIHEYDKIDPKPKDADAYLEALDTMVTAGQNLKSDLANRIAQIDADDSDKMEEIRVILARPFEQFMDITPPAEYDFVHDTFVSACNQFLDYIDKATNGKNADQLLTKGSEFIQKGTDAVVDYMVKSSQTEEE